ncbi:MAG: VCBS repeat-containing protein [Ignavibacteria bacterium]|nr:VCBS repeat-containing protein [Ignavibacteria bacterium]
MISSDFDSDGFVDIAGLDSTGRYLLVYFGKGANQFHGLTRYWLITKSDKIYSADLFKKFIPNLISLNKLSGKIEIYSFVNRKLNRNLDISVGYYPENLMFDDFTNSRTKEIICYGKNFGGISLITFQNEDYKIQKIDSENTYANVTPIFLNSDEYLDLAGISLKDQELHIFTNRNLRFSKSTIKKFTDRIAHLASSDFNDDNFKDICLISNSTNELIILYGNGLGGFPTAASFDLQYNADEIIIQDFTKDNLTDILFLDNASKNIFIKILKENHEWNSSIPLTKFNNLISFCLYRTRSQIGILCSEAFERNIFSIVNSSLALEKNIFTLSSNPTSIEVLKNTDEVINEICWIDKLDNNFCILKRNEFNTPERIYRFKLLRQFDSYVINKTLENQLDIVFFSLGKNYFDFVNFNLSDQSISRKTLTIYGAIDKILFFPTDHDTPNVAALNQRGNSNYITVTNPFKINPIIIDEPLVSSSVSNYFFDSVERILFYMQPHQVDTIIEFKSKKFNPTYSQGETKNHFRAEIKKGSQVITHAMDLGDTKKFDILNFFSSKGDGYLLTSFYQTDGYLPDSKEDEIILHDKSKIKAVKNDFSKTNEFYIYNENSQSVESLLSLKKGKRILTKKIKEDKEIREFTINLLPRERRELIYLRNNSPFIYLENF